MFSAPEPANGSQHAVKSSHEPVYWDLISTATPSSVGHGQMPPMSFRAGNEVRLDVEGLDEQRPRVAQ